ncbi:hypothetical protein BC940DRAFT_293947 [Gongronella butleri]|nr:hypothetical protein BC940DRAFT_293947 [Gongronella butleri]
MFTRLNGSVDLLSYYNLKPSYKQYIDRDIDETLAPFVRDLPGKTTLEPDGYMMKVLRDPTVEPHNQSIIQPLDMDTLKEAYNLKEGPIPGFDVSLLGTNDASDASFYRPAEADANDNHSDSERKHKKKKKKRKHNHDHDDQAHSEHKKKKKRKKEKDHGRRDSEHDHVIVD